MRSHHAAGLSRWEGNFELPDGTRVHVRPIRPLDADALIAFHEGLSEETVYRRFFSQHPHLSPEESRRFTVIDYQDRFALVAFVQGELVGVGRFDRVDGSNEAEVAFVVADGFQNHGIASLLLNSLAAAASERGIERLVADTLFSNQAMRHVFRACGFDLSQWVEGGIIHVEFPILPQP